MKKAIINIITDIKLAASMTSATVCSALSIPQDKFISVASEQNCNLNYSYEPTRRKIISQRI